MNNQVSVHQAVQNILTSTFAECPPLCSRWAYLINTASYGYLQSQGKKQWTSLNQNRSWSRIRIFFPESSFQWQVEKPAAPIYKVVWDIGGVMCAYVGMSMVSVIELVAYAFVVCYFVLKLFESRRKARNTVAPQ